MKNIFLISILFLYFELSAQNSKDSLKLIQLSGVVITSDSLTQMPFTTIFNKATKRGAIADYYGYFSMVVVAGDTLMFNYYGFKKSSFIVPDTLKENRYSIIHIMDVDTINLPEVNVYPWPSKEDFARAFLEMKPYDDALRRAQKQLSGENLAFAASGVSTDGSLSYSWAQNQSNTKLYTMGQTPVNNLLNPYSWASFIQAWKSGKLAKE